jgi:hypothetical protein
VPGHAHHAFTHASTSALSPHPAVTCKLHGALMLEVGCWFSSNTLLGRYVLGLHGWKSSRAMHCTSTKYSLQLIRLPSPLHVLVVVAAQRQQVSTARKLCHEARVIRAGGHALGSLKPGSRWRVVRGPFEVACVEGCIKFAAVVAFVAFGELKHSGASGTVPRIAFSVMGCYISACLKTACSWKDGCGTTGSPSRALTHPALPILQVARL